MKNGLNFKLSFYRSIYFGYTCTDFISLYYSRVMAIMTDERSCLCNWSINVVAGHSLEGLPCFGSTEALKKGISNEI